MAQINPVILGITFIVLAAGLFLAAWAMLRAARRIPPQDIPAGSLSNAAHPAGHEDAVLLVHSGGRVSYMNPQARQWFNVWEDEPNLERLAQRARKSEQFLSLCAGEGQARLALNGHFVEATSYQVPSGDGRLLLVSLRRPKWQVERTAGDSAGDSGQAPGVLLELSQQMSASLDLEKTLQAILEGVEQVIPSDVSEITLWEPEQELLTPYRFIRVPGAERRLEKAAERYQPGQGFSGYLVDCREPLLVDNVDAYPRIRLAVDRQRIPFNSYLGAPLLAGEVLVGTLELASLNPGSFSEGDRELLGLLSRQAAEAIHNARQFQKAQIQVQELAGLAGLSQSVRELSDPHDLFARLVESIAPLLEVEILGFLVYDENRRVLEGQHPFFGLPDPVIDMYRTVIEPHSEAEQIFQSQAAILAAEAFDDPRLETLGLHHITQAASMRNTLLVPLTSGGRMLGYLQAANKREINFGQEDVRLLEIIAAQTAPLVENVFLVEQSRRRAQRAETLRRIASLTGSAASLEEIIKYSMVDLARLLQVDLAVLYLLDEKRGDLRPQRASLFGLAETAGAVLGRVAVDDSMFSQTVTASQRSFECGELSKSDLPDVYRAPFEQLHLQSVLIVPLVTRERGIGEILMGSLKLDFFKQGDLPTVATAASQIAAAVEKSSLYSQTDQSLRQRVEQMTALTRVSRELNSSLDLERLLQRVHIEALRTTGADCGTILLFELNDTPERGKLLLRLGDSPPEGSLHGAPQAIERLVMETGETVRVEDFELPAAQLHPALEMQAGVLRPPHDDIRSALVAPITYQQRVVGLIHLHSRYAGHFDLGAQEITETLAIQASIAIGNAHRYQEQVRRSEMLHRRVETLSRLLETSRLLQEEQPLEQSLDAIASAIQSATPFELVLLSAYDPASGHLQRVSSAGIPAEMMADLKAHTQPWASIQQMLQPEFCLGPAYYIPHDRISIIPADIHSVSVLELQSHPGSEGQWHPDDFLLVPLLSVAGEPLGLISVDGPRNGLQPDRLTIETLEIFSSQAAITIESSRKLTALRRKVAALQDDLGQVRQAAQAAQGHLAGLLSKDLEQSAAIQQLSERARRINAGLGIAQQVNQQATRDDVLVTFGREMLEQMQLDCVLVVAGEAGSPRLLHTLGEIPAGANPESLLGQRNPLRHCLQTGELLLATDLEESQEWQGSPLLNALDARSFLCLPLTGEIAMLGTRRAPLISLPAEDSQLFQLLARQVAAALHNLDLQAETHRRLREVNLLLEFSRQLGALDAASILRALVESALHVAPAAETGMVALWDETQERLVPQAASGYAENARILEITYAAGGSLVGQVFHESSPLIVDEVNFARHYNLSSEEMLCYRDAALGRLPVSCMLAPVVSAAHARPLGVLMLENFKSPAAFTSDDVALITSLAQQTALTLENARLFQASEERAQQLQALTQVATTVTSNLQPDDLVAMLLDQLRAVLPYDTGTLWLRQQDQMVVRAARGFPDSEQRLGLTVAIEDSALLSEMIRTGYPTSVENVHNDVRFPSLMEYERLSWLGVPLIASGQVTGVIALEKTEPHFYTPEDALAATTFAGQAAVSLQNAQLYQESLQRAAELDQRSQRLAMLNRLSSELSRSLDATHILSFATQELYHAVPCSSVSGVIFDPAGRATVQAEFPPLNAGLPLALPRAELFDRLHETLGIFHSEDAPAEAELQPLASFLERHQTSSLLVIPLASGENLLGLLLAHTSRPYRFDADEIELARTICNQAAIAVQNARLFAETRSLTEDLEQRVTERTAEVAREHQRTELLLRVITELSASLDLDQVLNRTLHVLNEVIRAGQVSVLIARPGERKLQRIASVGYVESASSEGLPTPFDVDTGLAGWIIANRKPVLVDDLNLDPRWVKLPGSLTRHRSALGLPLMIGAEALGALMLFHDQVGHFSNDLLELVQAAANQIAISVNNAELYRLIRDQAEDLGTMLRNQQIETSRSKAILEAVADGVLVTNASRSITLFNASAEKILRLEREQVIGRSLEFFTGLFGSAARKWIETIDTWSQDPDAYQPGETFAEQIILEDGQVVSVRLAPVILRNDFLGTVSIFQDITHQVEVDRLKSEFVATVSHELRTPTTSIKGYVEVLLMGAAGGLGEQQRHFLEIVKANTERLAVLVNDLLDISRIEAGRVRLSSQPVNLEELAGEALSLLERRAREEGRNLEFVKATAPDLPRILGDPERVRQIFDNLLRNAYDYNLENGRITVQLQRTGDDVQVDVQDTGMGIPLAEQPRVFERFFRGESPLVLGVAGTGLGLSIVQNLVQMHHGRIWLESSGLPGAGSTFSFTLPIYKPRDDSIH